MVVSRIFWDTNLFVYLIENQGRVAQRVADLRARMRERGDQLVTSAFTLGEVLVKPIEAERDDLRDAYETAITAAAAIIPLDRQVAMRYARIRADRSIKPPDAIQLACAAHAGVDLFITNDERLSKKHVPGIQFVTSLDRVPL